MEPRIQYAKTEDGVNITYWGWGTACHIKQRRR